ncbi:type II toxin-antitoxin system MqsR family toxin [Halomonas cerina]|uniref:Uncharacterized protein n=1 Tax=Halomonas cerina TaxID=447424 RepID=A0A839V8W3_9GAMM|nr:type II toxin-antitoxin system MqsR family toxin [Halomonas cerina]MBB3192093.1 hypothetical protein [Halomonas cerina]
MAEESPHYPTEVVRELVRQRKCNFARNAYREAEDLGYAGEEKYLLLEELSESDYRYSVDFSSDRPDIKMDVYFVRRRSRLNPEYMCDIYVKILVTPLSEAVISIENAEHVSVRSFHLERGGRL